MLSSTRIAPVLLAVSLVLIPLIALHSVGVASPPSYNAAVKVGDWWNLGGFQGTCQAPCPPGLSSDFNITEATALVVGRPSATSVIIKNTIMYTNQTIKTYTTSGDVSSGTGNLSSAPSILIAGGLVPGNTILQSTTSPVINATTTRAYAGENRTLNILNETVSQRTYLWDQATGILVSFTLNQSSAHLTYKLTGTNLWTYRIVIYDGACQPIIPVSCGYTPLQSSIIVGTTVTFNNTGAQTHSVYSCTANNNPPPSPQACSTLNYPSTAPSFASGSILAGKAWNLTFTVPGMYYYYDAYNANMKGLLTVLTNASTPFFNVSVSPNPITVHQGLSSTVTISATGSGGYTGSVTFNGLFPTGPNYPTSNGPCCGTGNFYGGSGGFGISFAVSAGFNTPQGVYNAILAGAGNNIAQTIPLTIIVTSPGPTVYLTPNGNSTIAILPGLATTLTIGVQSVAGYKGQVNLWCYSYSGAYLEASIAPSSVTLQPNSSANATLTLNAGPPGSYTVTVWAQDQNLTWTQKMYLSVEVVHVPLLYKLSYIGTPAPGAKIMIINSFTDTGDIPEQILSGAILTDFGVFPLILNPTILLQPGQTATYNMTITIPIGTPPGNHPVTISISWECLLGTRWTQAPPLTSNTQILIQSTPSSTVISVITNLARAAEGYWLWFAGIYIPLVAILASYVVIHEQRRKRAPCDEDLPQYGIRD